ncbi:ABC transporter permease [Kaistia dalseonensis]|uniref:Xylose transport system permease protein XylH n=1 Tax=Kaistia dalseonensis TaxID=410840 RepID=A0ABU0H3X9_9HYPH|nr:ABC transporter permease [Kaistia dalseonensis]MCX5494418.1 ABC transporter permease [Kaistia dalseonensis]MDQ0436997.1 simple sugar transport system permease protein [Kaistia dalseonensis]
MTHDLASDPAAAAVSAQNARARRRGGFAARMLRRPELGAFGATIFVFLFFAVTAGDSGLFSVLGITNFLQVSAQLGILSAAVALLMIGGEFDLSLGSMIGFAGIIIGICVVQFGLPIWLSVIITFLVAIVIGALNGLLVTRTRLPSFIVTLASYFVLRGLSLVVTRMLTGRTQIPYITKDTTEGTFVSLFAGKFGRGFFTWLGHMGWIDLRPDGLPVVQGLPMSVAWWIGLTALATWILVRTRFGNWIFAVGGDIGAARNVGVPVERVKIMLFIGTACAATLFATIQVLEAGSADVLRGTQKEFEAVIAAVIGGNLLTGGYGSAIGAMFGSLIFGTVQMGIFYTGVDNDWFMVFLGLMVLVAVLFNNYVRRKATEAR